MKGLVVVALLASLLMGGCQRVDRNESGPAASPSATLVKETTDTKAFRVTAVRRPHSGKHSRPFRVSLEAVNDGHGYERIRVARRCYGWRQVKVGSVVRLNEVTRHYSDGTLNHRIANIETVCPNRRRSTP